MEHFERDIAQMKMQINEMYSALMGNSISKDGGLVQRIQRNEEFAKSNLKEIAGIKNKMIRTNTYVNILWAACGAVGMAILAIVIRK